MTQGPFRMLRRTVLAACMFAGFLAFAAPAAAAPLCSGADADNPIDFGDGEGSLGDGSICRNFIAGVNNAAYYWFDFGTGSSHLLRVTVDTVLQDFGLTFTRTLLDAGTVFAPFFNYICVNYGPGDQCVEYSADDPPVEGEEFAGDVTWLIAWEEIVGISPIPEIIHERTFNDQNGDALYDEILEGIFFSAELGPADFACDYADYQTCDEGGGEGPPPDIDFLLKTDGDPVRAATSNNFSKVAVVQTTPEPGTLALLGLGFGGFVLNRCRRRKN